MLLVLRLINNQIVLLFPLPGLGLRFGYRLGLNRFGEWQLPIKRFARFCSSLSDRCLSDSQSYSAGVALFFHDTPSQVNRYGLCEADLLYVDLISTGTLVGTLLSLYSVIV